MKFKENIVKNLMKKIASTLNGLSISKILKCELKRKMQVLKAQHLVPKLATVIVGKLHNSIVYLKNKHNDCREIGLSFVHYKFKEDISENKLIEFISHLNNNQSITSYIIQMPLPKHINTHNILSAIDPAKDADGMSPVNLGKLVLNNFNNHSINNKFYNFPIPCTPRGIIELFNRYNLSWNKRKILIIGRGINVGKPLSLLLLAKSINSAITIVNKKTKKIDAIMRESDIIISAAGVPNLVKAQNIKPKSIILDVGITTLLDNNGRYIFKGDVESGVKNIASWVSPNPGGVGPMTRAMLLTNVVESFERAINNEIS